jgi:hypothetical protein
VIRHLLRIAFNKLQPGGLAYFQVPTYAVGYNFVLPAYLVTRQPPGHPEMHVLPQPVLFKLISECDCRLVELREDGAAGPRAVSNRVLVQKLFLDPVASWIRCKASAVTDDFDDR